MPLTVWFEKNVFLFVSCFQKSGQETVKISFYCFPLSFSVIIFSCINFRKQETKLKQKMLSQAK